MTLTVARYGARPSLPDARDHHSEVHARLELPAEPADVDLRAQGPLVWDQGQLGSCVPHGWLRAYNHAQRRQAQGLVSPSALFTYWVGRSLEGTVGYDSGLYVRDGGKAIANEGVADRFAWPYDIGRFTQRPAQAAWNQADRHLALHYTRLHDFRYIHNALQAKLPVVMGFSVYESFEDTGPDGLVPIPSREAILGGHCVLIEGYRTDLMAFVVANSWGSSWGDRGYCYFPDVLFEPDRNVVFGDDLWTLESVT